MQQTNNNIIIIITTLTHTNVLSTRSNKHKNNSIFITQIELNSYIAREI